MGEQGAASDAEIFPASLAAEAQHAVRAAALINRGALTMGANGLASGPAEITKRRLGFRVRHTEARR